MPRHRELYKYRIYILKMNNTEVQQALITHRLLDPPADGKWGSQSEGALKDFQRAHGLSPTGSANDETLKKLSEPPKPINFGKDLASRIVRYLLEQNYWVPAGDRRFSIVYCEGMNPDGQLNNDKFNEWNDARIVIEIPDNTFTPCIVGAWDGTCEPGDKYTYNPMNPAGAFRIAFGQYRAWKVGIHNNNHEALVQVGEVSGFRDANKDGIRTGDKRVKGLYGINQHHGWDMAQVKGASAGCLVGRFKKGHAEFMRLIKSDRRYQLNNSYTFYTAIIDGSRVSG